MKKLTLKPDGYGQQLAKARDKWFDSDQGKRMATGEASGQYLRNRLELAFVAGAEAYMAIVEKMIGRVVANEIRRRRRLEKKGKVRDG